ncbi:MAG TPA: hypothetical protein VFK06_08085 [Candidatus Angelobacter sp.]|nr:hypothetical protein [Candidatus Angelobacter sp.]
MLDHEWGQEAFKRFPELIDRFDFVDTPHQLWFELTDSFFQAYKAPLNDDLISRIYDYANWCCTQPKGTSTEDDLGSCVCVCFYEHIPESSEALQDMPRWFSLSDVLTMRETFSYLAGEDGFQRILLAYERSTEPKK